jgi:hypothetical protein
VDSNRPTTGKLDVLPPPHIPYIIAETEYAVLEAEMTTFVPQFWFTYRYWFPIAALVE